jgi:hypothetical protein
LKSSLPDSLNIGAANAAVATENGHTEVNGCGSHDAIRHVRHRRAGDAPHSVNDLNREGGLFENVVRIGQGVLQIGIGVRRQAALLNEINDFG